LQQSCIFSGRDTRGVPLHPTGLPPNAARPLGVGFGAAAQDLSAAAGRRPRPAPRHAPKGRPPPPCKRPKVQSTSGAAPASMPPRSPGFRDPAD